MAGLVLASELPGAGGRLPSAAALAVAAARGGKPVILAEVGGARGRGPTMLGAESARSLEARLRDGGFEAAARGHLAWLRLDPDGWNERLEAALELVDGTPTVVAVLEPMPFGAAVEAELGARAALLRADLPRQRSLAALAATELRRRGIFVRISGHQLGRVAARRALAGIDPGGGASRRSARQAAALLGERPPSPPGGGLTGRRLATESGQALPLVLGGILALVACTLALAAIGGAVTGKARVQRAADLAALSAAREMRDQFDRLFVAVRRPDGSLDPDHFDKREYLDRAKAAAVEAARRNGVEPRRLAIEFPDRASFAPLRVRAEISAELDAGAQRVPLSVHAEAEAVPASAAPAAGGGPAVASGGGYSGPLAYRQGEGMRPDVAAAFDRMAAAAAARRGLAAGERRLSIRRRASGAVGAESRPDLGGATGHVAASLRDRAGPRPALRLRLAGGERRAVRLHPALLVGGLALRLHRGPGALFERRRRGRVGGSGHRGRWRRAPR